MINKSHKYKIQFINSGYIITAQYTQIKTGNVRDKTIFPIIDCNNKIYHSNNYGDFIIINNSLKEENNNKRKCIIKFINTGYEYEVPYQDAINGNVKDQLFYNSFINKIFNSTKSGKFKIIKIIDKPKNKYALIQFINTGNVIEARFDHILSGNVLDPDTISFKRPGAIINEITADTYSFYKRWDSMLRRCYDKNDYRYNMYKDVYVCDRWFLFDNYIKDIKNLPGFEKAINDLSNFNIDKDLIPILNNENKCYSPNTCIWLHYIDNISLNRYIIPMKNNGCRIIPLQNGDFLCDLYVNNVFIKSSIYKSLHDAYNEFIIYYNNKTMCEIIN